MSGLLLVQWPGDEEVQMIGFYLLWSFVRLGVKSCHIIYALGVFLCIRKFSIGVGSECVGILSSVNILKRVSLAENRALAPNLQR